MLVIEINLLPTSYLAAVYTQNDFEFGSKKIQGKTSVVTLLRPLRRHRTLHSDYHQDHLTSCTRKTKFHSVSLVSFARVLLAIHDDFRAALAPVPPANEIHDALDVLAKGVSDRSSGVRWPHH
jgi:hypothetical protein